MRLKLYLDTSVLGAVCDPGPEERLLATHRLLEGFTKELWDGYISTLVLEEVGRAPSDVRERLMAEIKRRPFVVLEETEASVALAKAYVAAGAIPADYEDDARHIAVATVSDIRTIVSWNFRHMVNVERKRMINSVNVREGLPLVDIVSPWEVSHEQA